MNCDCGGQLDLLPEEQRYQCVDCKESMSLEEYEFAHMYLSRPSPATFAQPRHLQLIQGPFSFLRHVNEARNHAAHILGRPPEVDAPMAVERLKRAVERLDESYTILNGLSQAFPGVSVTREYILAAWGDAFIALSAATLLATELSEERGEFPRS